MKHVLIIEDDLLLAVALAEAITRTRQCPPGPVPEAARALPGTSPTALVWTSLRATSEDDCLATTLSACGYLGAPTIYLIPAGKAAAFRQLRLPQPSLFPHSPLADATLRAAAGPSAAQPPHPHPSTSAAPAEGEPTSFSNFVFVRKGSEYVRLFLSDILYVEALQNYIKIYTNSEAFIVDSTLKNFKQKLPANFIKTHRCYIVNINNIQAYQETTVSVGRHQVPISRSCQEELRSRINVLR